MSDTYIRAPRTRVELPELIDDIALIRQSLRAAADGQPASLGADAIDAELNAVLLALRDHWELSRLYGEVVTSTMAWATAPAEAADILAAARDRAHRAAWAAQDAALHGRAPAGARTPDDPRQPRRDLMGGRHRNWHRAWSRVQGDLHHESGLVVHWVPTAQGPALEAYPDSIHDMREHERRRGVPEHDLQGRLERLMHEASLWSPGTHNRA